MIKINLNNIQTVSGLCEQCGVHTVLISLVSDFYRCTNCGEDTKQYINGKIRYINLSGTDKAWLRSNQHRIK